MEFTFDSSREDVAAIWHGHEINTSAVSQTTFGVLPLSQEVSRLGAFIFAFASHSVLCVCMRILSSNNSNMIPGNQRST